MDTDRRSSLTDIATRFLRPPGYFARLLRLNYLAPDIVMAILDGRQPPGITRKKLIDANLPMDWSLQRRLLAFPERPGLQIS
ncbi:hypothetical protein [Sphingomonas sp. OTU376]|uniref:hypothetical protein n=1 Tax=Sphingomonas sp. OTU376 TaxID=3043863 RepID=UPI00313CE8B2